jgi:hypothetical protein
VKKCKRRSAFGALFPARGDRPIGWIGRGGVKAQGLCGGVAAPNVGLDSALLQDL